MGQTRLDPKSALGVEKTKPILSYGVWRSEFSVKMRKRNLKKQSQFAPAQIGAKSFLKGDYDNKLAGGDKENKANQSMSLQQVQVGL